MFHLRTQEASDVWNYTKLVEYNDWIDEEQKPAWALSMLCPQVYHSSAVEQNTIYVASGVKNDNLTFIKYNSLIVDCSSESIYRVFLS